MGEQMLNAFKCPHGFVRYYNDCKYQNRDECVKCECGQYIVAEKVYLAILLEKYGLDCLWISVNDRLPIDMGTVLVAHKGGVSFAWFNGEYWTKGATTKHRPIKTVTHWMPLPEPPERESIPVWWLKKMMSKSASSNEELVENICGVLDAWDTRDACDESK